MPKHDELSTYLDRVGGRSFGYGPDEMDCSRFVAGWLRHAGLPLPQGTDQGYASARAAARLIHQHGSLENLARAVADTAVIAETDAPRRGDIGLVHMGRETLLAVCAGGGIWIGKAHRGIVCARMKHKRAWKVNSGGSIGAAAIGILLLGEAIAGTVIVGSITVGAVVGTVVLTAASIGLQYAIATLNKPKTDPQNIQQVIRQSTAVRVRHYGTVKTGGAIVFSETRNGLWHELVVTGSGRIDSVVKTFANDTELVLDANGQNSAMPYSVYVRIDSRLGLDNQTAYPWMLTNFGDVWTAEHALNGLSSYLKVLRDPGPKAFGKNFAGGLPRVMQIIRGARVFDPRDHDQGASDKETWAWSDNAALVILDYLTHDDGYGFSIDSIDIDAFTAFANLCDQLVPLKGGGFEKRYRACGTYSFGEARKDVLAKLLATCDGRVFQKPDGKISVDGGQFVAPEAVIDDHVIVGAEWVWGRDATERVNELKPIFVSPDHDFQETEAAPWQDRDAITLEGLISQPFNLQFVPSHSQAQRLAKIAGWRIRTGLTGTIKCNLGGLVAYQQRFIEIDSPLTGKSGIFIVDKFDIVVGGGDGHGVTLTVTQVDPSHWAWDAAGEQGDAPPVPIETGGSQIIEVPEGLTAVIQPVTVSAGVTGGRLTIAWDEPSRILGTEVRYRRRIVIDPPEWEDYQTLTVDPGILTVNSGVIDNDGSMYEITARHVATGGTTSEYTAPVTIIATADAVPPATVTGFTPVADDASIILSWVTPNSANFAATRLYINSTDTLTGATLEATVYSAPSQAQSYTITGLDPGTYWVLATAVNGSGVASAPVSASVTVA